MDKVYIYIYIYIYTHIQTLYTYIYVYIYTHTHSKLFLHTVNYSLTLKKFLLFAKTWIYLDSIMLSKIRQSEILQDFAYMWNQYNKINEQLT